MISPFERVVIVGSATRLPHSGSDQSAFWADIAARADRSTEVPAERWILPPDRCVNAQIPHPDSVYSTRGYFLSPFTPDLTGLAVDAGLVSALDKLFQLILDVGSRAWRSAQTQQVNPRRVGVILGNICLPTESSNALCREYLGSKLLKQKSTSTTHPMNRFVAGLPAGLLAKSLGLGGGSFTLDAACASSLYAIHLACSDLLAGRADAVLAGGVNAADSQYTQMGFAQLRALSPSGRCSPFDARADGLMVGEGAGIFVLKRLSDALKQGDKIHGLIAGIGLSNDMHGNLLAPAKEGQLRAMQSAYKMAGWGPGDVDLIECHATGTPVGDAVEFESLRELWGESGWAPGQCVIGSVKSTVGHLLTGAGAAAVAKVLRAMATETLPPQTNFESPAATLNYADGPFQILSESERWIRRSSLEPRRAAVSGFGFGGVNAHLLLEEWTGIPVTKLQRRSGTVVNLPRLTTVAKADEYSTQSRSTPAPIAVVGLAAHIGPWVDLRAVQERIFNGDECDPIPKQNGWGLAASPSPAGYYIERLDFPIDRFRIPPKELLETLPQQLLMLQVAAAALDDSTPGKHYAGAEADPRTGVFIGLELDPNTTNFHLRWAVLAEMGSHVDDTRSVPATAELSPPLTADRTMGALGSVAASRIARAFGFGGPSHTLCNEDSSSARALERAVRALRAREVDRAVVGGVDLAGDPRVVLADRHPDIVPGEGAVAFVLKRLDDATRDGDRVYAVIRGVGVAGGGGIGVIDGACNLAETDADIGFERVGYVEGSIIPTTRQERIVPLASGNAEHEFGWSGAASAGISFVKACLALYQEIIPGNRTSVQEGQTKASSQYWLHDRIQGPRRAAVTAAGVDGTGFVFMLEEFAQNTSPSSIPIDRRQPTGARSEAVFAVSAATTPLLDEALTQLGEFARNYPVSGIEAIARGWFQSAHTDTSQPLNIGLVARSVDELAQQIEFARTSLAANPARSFPQDPQPQIRDRVFFNPKPIGLRAKVALVFPGSGNAFDGMGRSIGTQWPELLRKQQAESELLRSQFAPQFFWDDAASAASDRDQLFGQVTLGALVADLCALLKIPRDAMIGLSLGESAGLFGIRAWQSRDEMYRRISRSSLFVSDLAPPYNAARQHWSLADTDNLDWATAVISASANDIHAALRPGLHAYLSIVNTGSECVIGGIKEHLLKLAAAVGKPVHLLKGVTLAHCEAALPVEMPYRELHTLPVTAPKGMTVYSGAWGKSYTVTSQSAADSITAGLVSPIDVTAVIDSAYRAGVRTFIEVGPGTSCTRMIDSILAGKPHLARAVHPSKADPISHILRLIASLISERVSVDLGALYGEEMGCVGHRLPVDLSGKCLEIPVGQVPLLKEEPAFSPLDNEESAEIENIASRGNTTIEQVEVVPPMIPSSVERDEVLADAYRTHPDSDFSPSDVIKSTCDARVAAMQAHETFLRLNRSLTDSLAGVLRFQTALLNAWMQSDNPSPLNPSHSPPRALDFEQCCQFAVGKIGDVLGPMFAEVDHYQTRVRLPDGPLQLVDRITLIEGIPKSMSGGRVVTEHTVREDRWYLEAGRIPTAIAVEAGQADLFLSGFLGIDFHTQGLAVYRLLDAVVTFHRGLPQVGETIVYDIHIDEFWKPGESWLFRFHFDGTINGKPFITMRDGVAGFFTAEALAAGRGIVQTTLDLKRMPGKLPPDWRKLIPPQACSLDRGQVDALRRGDLVAAFGPAFKSLQLDRVATLPGGMLRLVDRVPVLDPKGGRFGIGFVRAEFDLSPNDWFLTCHFVDDKVMPGTLMYECCLHTLRTLLMSMGWVGEAGEIAYEPVSGIESRLKCRGQVIPSTRMVTYEVTVKELGFNPEPYCIAEALMSADGKPIVEIGNLSTRLTGSTRLTLERAWGLTSDEIVSPAIALVSPTPEPALYDRAQIMAYSNGNPSEAFGEPYRIFDRDRILARLPGPPYQFLDRITAVNGEPFVLKAGASCVAKYEVQPDAWYFAADRSEKMPFSILLEVALQPCGWLAAYCGSALASKDDLAFRNLGGKATQLRAVTSRIGTLTTSVKLTNVSSSAGMIIQHYDLCVRAGPEVVYEGTTYFGFFSRTQLANQVGIRDAQVPWPTGQDVSRSERERMPADAPFSAPMLRMVDRVDTYLPDGGMMQLGLAVGSIAVNPEFWFFTAHFYQDPVWPGSLGLESFIQLMKFAAWKRWGIEGSDAWQAVGLGKPHSWSYRGQVLPTDQLVTVLMEVTAEDRKTRTLTANGFLTVDGRVIYQMTNFTLSARHN